jgi:hypothetical protein
MRAGRAGLKELAPPANLFEDFEREKAALAGAGRDAAQLHRETFQRVGYRERYLRHIRASVPAMAALRRIVLEAASSDVYLMCMCPYQTAGEACHTYLLLELARELAPTLEILPEPTAARALNVRRPRTNWARGLAPYRDLR